MADRLARRGDALKPEQQYVIGDIFTGTVMRRTESIRRPPAVRVPSDVSPVESPLGRRRRQATPFAADEEDEEEGGSPLKRRGILHGDDGSASAHLSRSASFASGQSSTGSGGVNLAAQRSYSFGGRSSTSDGAASGSFARRVQPVGVALGLLQRVQKKVTRTLNGPQRSHWLAQQQRRLSADSESMDAAAAAAAAVVAAEQHARSGTAAVRAAGASAPTAAHYTAAERATAVAVVEAIEAEGGGSGVGVEQMMQILRKSAIQHGVTASEHASVGDQVAADLAAAKEAAQLAATAAATASTGVAGGLVLGRSHRQVARGGVTSLTGEGSFSRRSLSAPMPIGARPGLVSKPSSPRRSLSSNTVLGHDAATKRHRRRKHKRRETAHTDKPHRHHHGHRTPPGSKRGRDAHKSKADAPYPRSSSLSAESQRAPLAIVASNGDGSLELRNRTRTAHSVVV